MARDMLQFVTTAQETPEKRAADKRRTDFDEIYQEFGSAVRRTVGDGA